jgi:hypothetical protein
VVDPEGKKEVKEGKRNEKEVARSLPVAEIASPPLATAKIQRAAVCENSRLS